MDLTKAKAPDVSLAGSYLSDALLARRLYLTHDLDLGGATLRAAVIVVDANIGGAFGCSGARLSNGSGPALLADRLTVGGGVFLHDGFTATGTRELGAVRLLGANISGVLDCLGAQLGNDSGPAPLADRLTIAGSVFLHAGFTATGAGELGAVRLPSANISGQLACPGAQLRNDDGPPFSPTG